jgi:ubiquinol-cytochrome c reductase cytochrome b subunit
MDKDTDAEIPKSSGLATLLFRWFDHRTGVHDFAKKVLDEHIPGGARFAYVFGSGLLFIFLLQAVTGVCLALYYTPTAETAHTSVAYITKQVAGGAFLRSLHSYGSSAMIIVLALHFLQTFLFGSYKGRRELLWLSGALLSFLVLGMGFTGYLLPWDQKAYFATAVGTNIMGQAPLIGNLLIRLVRGGDTIGTLTLSRFYVAHVFLIPATIFMFIGAHILLFRKAGPAGPVKEHPITPKLPPEHFYPRQVLMDMAFVLLIMAALAALSYFHPATLGPIVNPADTHFLPRPEWYYLPMFEWLKFWEGPYVVVGVMVLPGLLAMVFFLMPFLDRKLERSPWRRPIPVLAVAFVVLGMVFLGAKSRSDDRDNPDIAAQLDLQAAQEKAYSAAPFEPYLESPEGMGAVLASTGTVSPLVAVGKGIFTKRGCIGCHGGTGMGTAAAPSLVGVTRKFPEAALIALLHNPSPKMRAGRMPVVDAPPSEMSALVAYLGVLGTSAANVPPIYNLPAPQPSPGAIENVSFKVDARRFAGDVRQAAPTALSASAVVGQQLFQERACFACHGQAGTGGRAPALAPLIAKLPDAQLMQLLQDPNSRMRAGGMPPVVASPEQIGSLISYLRTLPLPQPSRQVAPEYPLPNEVSHPEMRLAPPVYVAENTPPAFPGGNAILSKTVVPVGTTTTLADSQPSPGRELFVARGCIACHGTNAQGTRYAPSLIGVATRFPGDKLPYLLHRPTSKMHDGGMPAVTLNDAQMADLVAYLSSLQPAPAAPPTRQVSADLRVATAQPEQSIVGVAQTTSTLEVRESSLSPLAARGKRIFQRSACETCHGVGGINGTIAAPGLAGTASLLPESTIEALLRHHTARMEKGGMPLTNFNAQDMRGIVSYIRSMTPAPEGKKLVASEIRSARN